MAMARSGKSYPAAGKRRLDSAANKLEIELALDAEHPWVTLD